MRFFLSSIIVTLFLFACGDVMESPNSSAAPPSSGVGEQTAVTPGGSYRVTIIPAPNPLPLNEMFSLRVVVEDAEAGTPSDVTASVDAWMPHHGHGMNVTPAMTTTATGAFVAKGMQLHMPGLWEIYVDVYETAERESAVFQVRLEP